MTVRTSGSRKSNPPPADASNKSKKNKKAGGGTKSGDAQSMRKKGQQQQQRAVADLAKKIKGKRSSAPKTPAPVAGSKEKDTPNPPPAVNTAPAAAAKDKKGKVKVKKPKNHKDPVIDFAHDPAKQEAKKKEEIKESNREMKMKSCKEVRKKEEKKESKKEVKQKESERKPSSSAAGNEPPPSQAGPSSTTPTPTGVNTPTSNISAVPTNPPAAAKSDSDDEEDEPSSNCKTPPENPEPNETPDDVDPSCDAKGELGAKDELVTVGKIKVKLQDAVKGSFGMGLVVVKDVDKKVEGVAIGSQFNLKYESKDNKIKRLYMEIEVMKAAVEQQRVCVPLFVAAGDVKTYSCCLVEGLGPSLAELSDKHDGFSAPTTLKIALISLDLLRNFHALLYIHRDIRPSNFFIGREGFRNKLMIGNMSCSKKYGIKKEVEPEEKCDLEIRRPKFKTKVWKPRKKVCFLGSLKYAPRSSHLKHEHTRRDDIESWFYMIAEFTYKTLPWKALTDKDKIHEAKETYVLDSKFEDEPNRKFGGEMAHICEYFAVQNYYEMEPDYGYVEICILNMLKEANKTGSSDKFDWEGSKEKVTEEKKVTKA